jgi:radical SAM superfamily enzyme YgiQ (UPF0313 family)
MPDTVVSLDNMVQMPNLAVASLAGNISDCDIKIQDLVGIRKDSKKFILDTVADFRPNIVGFSAMTFQYPTAQTIARWIHSIHPDIKLALGGYHGSLAYAKLRHSVDIEPFDFIIRGEGEKTFDELAQELQSTSPDLSSIRGLTYLKNGVFSHNPPRSLSDLSTIRLPDRSRRIIHRCRLAGIFPMDVIEASRGCTMACKFCSITQVYGRSFRKYEIPRIIEDIGCAKAMGAKSLFFVDDNLTLDINHFEAVCEAICEAGHNDIHYSTQASCKGIASSERLVSKMAKAGFDTVFLGIENVSRRNLEQLKKGDIVEHSRKAAKYLHKYNIGIVGGLIIGNPDDREQDIIENFNFARELGCEIIYVQYLTPYPQTMLKKDLEELDLIVNKTNISEYNGFFCNVRTKHLSKDDLIRFYSREVIRYIFHGLKPWVFVKNAYFKRYFVQSFFKFYWLRFLLMNRWIMGLLINSIKRKPKPFKLQ